MAWTSANYILSFDAEAGAVASLATTAQKILWFNEGQARLLKYSPLTDDITWLAADRSVALNSDFVEMQKIIFAAGVSHEPWRVFGQTLVTDDPGGASAAGSARVYYWADWPVLTNGGSSSLNAAHDYACLYYALHRFYKLLSSNRFYYKRYATLVGANVVTASDLQQEADRYYQDFLDSREDNHPVPPAFYFEG